MRDVSASYDSKNLILKNVSMNVKRGTNYAIVGASGSGKSTLLKLMNGMMIPSSGVVDRKSTRLNSSHSQQSRMPSSA